ncbi:MAG TPA: UDP-N-acetylmuramoyl-L-alanine--D-glutamate ligase [bacterium]|jgi:UDP-N-acetylmuramoylalanine--D-glutamate ligase
MKAYPKKTRFVVWGYGVTGRSLARVLISRGYRVTVIDDRPEDAFVDFTEDMKDLRKKGVRYNFGGVGNLVNFVTKNADVLSPSPGINVPRELIDACTGAKIQVSGELEIAYRLVAGRLIAVTGTDGKTTVATLIHRVMEDAGIQVHLAGNIGEPYIDLAGKTKPDHWIVVEVSSYQLETVRLFRPYIAVLLNIAQDHMERHRDIRVYTRVKGRIFERQRHSEHSIINFDDPACLQAYGKSLGKIHGFSLAGKISGGAWRNGIELYIDTENKPVPIMKLSDLKIHGDHNHLNVLASIMACKLAGCEDDSIRTSISEFQGLPHRIETVGESNEVLWVNDSKATNIHATISAIKCFDRPIILLLGGYDKGLDLIELIPYIKEKVKHVVLLGNTRSRFKRALKEYSYKEITSRKTLAEACSAAKSLCAPGDVVLLSPASSSFDQFGNYMERGDSFRSWVQKKALRQKDEERTIE